MALSVPSIVYAGYSFGPLPLLIFGGLAVLARIAALQLPETSKSADIVTWTALVSLLLAFAFDTSCCVKQHFL